LVILRNKNKEGWNGPQKNGKGKNKKGTTSGTKEKNARTESKPERKTDGGTLGQNKETSLRMKAPGVKRILQVKKRILESP